MSAQDWELMIGGAESPMDSQSGRSMSDFSANVSRFQAIWLVGWRQTGGPVPCFLEREFGSCMLHGHRIISWSLADCTSGDACEIGIRTREDYRCRGLGTFTAAATVDLGLSRYRSVGWHCDEQNIASIRVAEKVKVRAQNVDILQKSKGESEVPVAAASILAKLIFEETVRDLGMKYDVNLKETTPSAIPKEVLPKVAKLHFSNVEQALRGSNH